MKVTAKKMLSYAAAFACLALVSVSASWAQTDVYRVNYFANNVTAAPDETVRIDNPGLTYGNLCAMVYVFDNDQQLTECCGCLLTHNGLRTLSVKNNLTANPLTGKISNNGVIKIVSSTANVGPHGPTGAWCDPTANVKPTPNLREWGTHVQAVGAGYAVTETNFTDSTLGTAELSNLQAQCSFVILLGSGNGVCSCGTGD